MIISISDSPVESARSLTFKTVLSVKAQYSCNTILTDRASRVLFRCESVEILLGFGFVTVPLNIPCLLKRGDAVMVSSSGVFI